MSNLPSAGGAYTSPPQVNGWRALIALLLAVLPVVGCVVAPIGETSPSPTSSPAATADATATPVPTLVPTAAPSPTGAETPTPGVEGRAIAIDSHGVAHVLGLGSSGAWYARNVGGDFKTRHPVDASAWWGHGATLVIDAADRPHLLFVVGEDEGPSELWYATGPRP
jgi:hypothetical protein